MKRILLLCSVFTFALLGEAWAQERTITGKVTSAEDNSSLPGVNVSVKGTTNGTTTSANGTYQLSVPTDATLVFSFIGLLTQEVEVGTRTTVDVRLRADQKQLNEVVVVGYGTQQKRDITGSVTQIKGTDVSSLPVQSFEQGLQGRAAGVSITTPNGVLGNPPIIRIRGVNSISSSSQPLIIIDNLPISNEANVIGFTVSNALSDLNPSDIESYEILKDASATAIYGSRAANGVILITTKKGKKGKPSVNIDSWVGITEPFRKFDVLNAEEYVQMKNEGYKNWVEGGNSLVNNRTVQQGIARLDTIGGKIVDTDWNDVVFRRGLQQNYAINVSGATDQTSYLFSAGYTNQQGMLRANSFRRYTTRVNIEHKIIDRLTVGANVQYANSVGQSPNSGVTAAFNTSGLGRIPLVQPPNVPVYNEDGSYNIDVVNNRLGVGNNAPSTLGLNFPNPQPELDLNKSTNETNRIFGNIFLDLRLLEGLNLRTTYGLDNLNVEGFQFQSPVHGDGFAAAGLVNNILFKNRLFNWQNTLNFTRKFNQLNLTTLLGTEWQETTSDGWGGSRQGVADNFFNTFQGTFFTNNPPVGNLQTKNGLLSYFARVNLSLADKYLLSANVRRDGFSALAAGNKWGNFWGASAGWRLSEENFIKGLEWDFLSDFKIRGSIGTVGNTFLPTNFGSLALYNGGLYGTVGGTFTYGQAASAQLRWESNTKLDLGVDAAFFNNRLQLEFAYYRNDLSDLVLFNPEPPSKGIPGSPPGALPFIPGNAILANVAKMKNSGIELTINTTNIDRGGFVWTTGFNISTLRNEVQQLDANNNDINTTTGGLEQTNITRVGESIGSLYAVPWVRVNPANGRAVFRNRNGAEVQYNHAAPAASRWTYVSDNSVAPSPAGDRVMAGTTLPKWFGGLNNTFKYKNFDLNIFLQFSGGNKIYNGTKAGLLDQRMWNNSTEVLQRWTTPGQVTTVPRVVYGDNFSNGSAFAITRNIESGDFLRFRNIVLAYNFRDLPFIQKAGLNNVRLYAQVQNAFIITKYTGSDPEVSTNGAAQGFQTSNLAPGVDRNSTPQARTYTLGINVIF